MITRSRIPRGWVSRAVLAAVVIGGLFAMHGLAVPVAPTMLGAAPAHNASAHFRLSMAPDTMAARGLEARAASTVEAPTGCGMDHGNCVAVLPSQHQIHAGIAVMAMVPPPYPAGPVQLHTAHASRAPPDISLTRLCISRT